MDKVSKLGYSRFSPYQDSPFLDINTPNGLIDMSNTDVPLLGIGYPSGVRKLLRPKSGMYSFPGDTKVREVKLPIAQKGGLLPKAQLAGQIPTRQDSIILRNNAIEKSNFYRNNPMYKLTSSFPINKKALQDLAKQSIDFNEWAKRSLNRGTGTYMIFDATGKKIMFSDIAKKTGKVKGSNIIYSAPDLIENLVDTYYNPSSPPIYFSPNILPQKSLRYEGKQDLSDTYYYDLLAITPWDMLNPKEQEQRLKKYGVTGTPYQLTGVPPKPIKMVGVERPSLGAPPIPNIKFRTPTIQRDLSKMKRAAIWFDPDIPGGMQGGWHQRLFPSTQEADAFLNEMRKVSGVGPYQSNRGIIDESDRVEFQKGGLKKTKPPIYVKDPKDKRLKAYQDSLNLYNQTMYNLKVEDGYGNVILPLWDHEIQSLKTDPDSPYFYAKSGVSSWNPDSKGTLDKRFKNKINPKILPIGKYNIFTDEAWSSIVPIYKKPVQPYILQKESPEKKYPQIKKVTNSLDRKSFNLPTGSFITKQSTIKPNESGDYVLRFNEWNPQTEAYVPKERYFKTREEADKAMEFLKDENDRLYSSGAFGSRLYYDKLSTQGNYKEGGSITTTTTAPIEFMNNFMMNPIKYPSVEPFKMPKESFPKYNFETPSINLSYSPDEKYLSSNIGFNASANPTDKLSINASAQTPIGIDFNKNFLNGIQPLSSSFNINSEYSINPKNKIGFSYQGGPGGSSYGLSYKRNFKEGGSTTNTTTLPNLGLPEYYVNDPKEGRIGVMPEIVIKGRKGAFTNEEYKDAFENAKLWYQQYLSSPMYARMTRASMDPFSETSVDPYSGIFGDKYTHDRINSLSSPIDMNIDKTTAGNTLGQKSVTFNPVYLQNPNSHIFSWKYRPKITFFDKPFKFQQLIGNNEYDRIEDLAGVAIHEMGHVINNGLVPPSDRDLIRKFLPTTYFESPLFQSDLWDPIYLNKMQGTEEEQKATAAPRIKYFNYLSDYDEVTQRLRDLRYKMQKQGIYNPFYSPFKIEYLNNYKINSRQSDPLLQLRDLFDDAEIEILMNSVAKNKSKKSNAV